METTSTSARPRVLFSSPEQAKKEAQKDGIFAGLSSGLTAGLIGSKLMRFPRNTTIFCGVLTGCISGYMFSQAFLQSNMARLKLQEAGTNDTATQSQDDILH